MINISLMNNSLFLQNWRERMRPAIIISTTLILAIIVGLIAMNDFLNPHIVYDYSTNLTAESVKTYPRSTPRELTWTASLFIDLARLQAVILLLFGTLSAFRMASREISSGTLDFHRSSPTPHFNQSIGLILGSCSLEWCCFFVLSIIQFFICFLSDVPIMAAIELLIRLTATGLLFSTLGCFFGLITNPKNPRSGFAPLIFIAIFMWIIPANYMFGYIRHLSFFPIFESLNASVAGVVSAMHYYGYRAYNIQISNMLFGIKFPSFVMQILIQLPVLFFLFSAIKRKITQQENMILSKPSSLLFSMHILFFSAAGFLNNALYPNSNLMRYRYYYQNTVESKMHLFLYLAFFTAFFMIAMCSPSKLQFMRGLRLSKKTGLKKISASEDYSTTFHWMLAYCVIVTAIYSFFIHVTKIEILNHLFTIASIMAYIFFFGSTLEFFNLGKLNKKKAYLITTFIILWILLPIFVSLIKPVNESNIYFEAIKSISPFYGIAVIFDSITTIRHSDFVGSVYYIFAINGVLAVIASALALRTRCQVIAEVNSESLD